MEGMPSANPSEGFESSIQAVGPLSLPWWSNIDFIKLSRLDLLINVRRAQHFSDKGLVRWQDTTGKPKTRRNVCFYKYIYCDSLFSLSWVPLPLLSHDIQIQHVRESMKKYSVYTLVQNRHAYCYIMYLYLINHQEIQILQTSYNSCECIVQVPVTFTLHLRKQTSKKLDDWGSIPARWKLQPFDFPVFVERLGRITAMHHWSPADRSVGAKKHPYLSGRWVQAWKTSVVSNHPKGLVHIAGVDHE